MRTTIPGKSTVIVALMFASVCLSSNATLAAGREAPSGSEIADKLKGAKFDFGNSTTGVKDGKKCKFTPVVPNKKGREEREEGQIIGQIETELHGELEPGTYSLFLAKIGNKWKVYAESNGQIVAEATRVEAELASGLTRGTGKAEFKTGSWGFCILQWNGFNFLCFYFD